MAINLANNNSLANITALPSSVSGGGMTLISEQTASGSANLSFTSGIDDTYDSYVFKFYNIHPANNSAHFQFNISTDGGSNYNVTKTSTYFNAYHNEADNVTGLAYNTSGGIAQSTAYQDIYRGVGNGNDENLCGTLTLYNPSSTTFVKHYIINAQETGSSFSSEVFVAGYGNTTSSVDAVDFKMNSGNIDSGVIKLYGVS